MVFETHKQVHDARSRDGTNRLICIRQICRDDFGRAQRRLWIAANQPERLLLSREQPDEFVADAPPAPRMVIIRSRCVAFDFGSFGRSRVPG